MCGQSTAYNTYATLSYTNPLFMGFSGYLNVNKEIIFTIQTSYGVSEKYVTPRDFGSEVFFYINCDKIFIIIVGY